jgi:hypothetical protein
VSEIGEYVPNSIGGGVERVHKPIEYVSQYRDVEIVVVEFDHRGSTQAGEHYALPDDWKDRLKEVLKKHEGAAVAPEYCMPDLERGAFGELGTGEMARRGSEDSQGITDFFGYISRWAGSEGKNQLAMDPANTNWYFLLEHAVDLPRLAMIEGIKSKIGNRETNLFDRVAGKYRNIDESEMKQLQYVDARRLIIARGLMQEAIRTDSGQIFHLNAPRHAERVHNYIERQIDHERSTGDEVNVAKDQSTRAPKEEKRKMMVYGKGPLPRSVREYAPSLPTTYYQLEIDLKDTDEAIKSPLTDSSHQTKALEASKLKIAVFLQKTDGNGGSKTEMKQRQRLRKASEIVDNLLACNSELTQDNFRDLSRLMSTDWAWKLVREDKIH